MEVDSNHRSNLQQIYSLSPLATRESIHKNYLIILLNIHYKRSKHADVAQLAEQLICNQQVIGSSPIIGFFFEKE